MKAKKLSVLVLCIALLGTSLISCGTHTHTYSDDWAHDANNHWHAATCEHTEEKDDSSAHVDFDKNGVCDVCGYDADHTHTYQAEAEWTSNENQHWHAATCGHNVDSLNAADHVDENNDGVCDVCAYTPNHTHIFSQSWNTDGENHWHVALCEHDVISDKAAHTANAAGFCSICGVRMENQTIQTVADALTAAKLQETVVYAGVLEAVAHYSWGDEINTVNFEKNGHYLWMSDTANDMEYMYTLIDADTICALQTSWGETTRNNSATVEWMDGYGLNLLDSNPEGMAYGIVNLVIQLHDLAVENENYDFAETVGEDGTYSFTFGKKLEYFGSEVLYVITVSFTLDEETVAMTSATVSAVRYYMDQCELVELKDENGDPVEDEYHEVITYYVLNEDAEATSQYVINATQKVRPFDSKFLPDKLLVTSFDLVCEDPADTEELTPAPSEITLVLGSDNNLVNYYFTNTLPTTATLDLNGCGFSLTDAEGNEYTDLSNWDTPVFAHFSKTSTWDGSAHIMIVGKVAGTYTLTITCGLDSKTMTVTVVRPITTSISANVIDKDGVQEEKNEVNLYVGSSLNFNAYVDEECDDSYTAEITAGNESGAATLTAGTVSLWNGDVDVSVFTATAVGTYTVTLTSTVAEGVSGTLTIHVIEAPAAEDVLSGKYISYFMGFKAWTVEFDTEASTVTITDCLNGNKKGVYSYSYENGELTVTQLEGNLKDVRLILSDDMTLGVFNGYMTTPLEKDNSSETPDVPPVSGDKDVTGTASYEDATDVSENATYHTTIGAGEKVYFGVYYYSLPDPFADYDITVTCLTDGAQLYEVQIDPMGSTDFAVFGNSSVSSIDEFTAEVYFAIENTTDAEITVDFTVEAVEFTGWW